MNFDNVNVNCYINMLSLTANLLYILMILLFELKARLGSFLLLFKSCFLKIYTKFY